VVLGRKVSAGQAVDEPVQYSAGSQTPVDDRQTVVLENKVTVHCDVPLQLCVEHGVLLQAMAVPVQTPLSQWSPYVQAFPSSQAVPKAFGEHSH